MVTHPSLKGSPWKLRRDPKIHNKKKTWLRMAEVLGAHKIHTQGDVHHNKCLERRVEEENNKITKK